MKKTRSQKSHGIVPLSTIPEFPSNLLPDSSDDVGFEEKSIDQVLAWKSGNKVPSLPCGFPCPLQPTYSALQRTNAEDWKHSQIRNCTATVMCL
jgi:hypothetical protein